MLRGIEATKAGMMSILDYNDNIAHSLANVNTTAFKQTKVAFKNIQDSVITAMQNGHNNLETSNRIGTLSQGSVTDGYTIDFSQGTIKETGRNFDFAINGEGFFKMQMADGTYTYSRNGIFQVQQDGTLTDTKGNKIMNKDGVVKINLRVTGQDSKESFINLKKVAVKNNGEIYYEDKKLSKIDLFNFDDKTKLTDLGEGRYVSTDEINNAAKVMTNPNIEQNSIELSNANPILTTINAMNAQRAYESMSNVIQQNSTALQKATTSVGKAVG